MDLYIDDEPDTIISFETVYNDNLRKSANFLFDFEVVYRRAPEPDSDGEEDFDYENFPARGVNQTHEVDKGFLIGCDRAQIEDIVSQILDTMEVPSYIDIIHTLTTKMSDLKKSPEVERIKLALDVIVQRFSGEYDDNDYVVDVKLAVAPASNEAMEKHLETVVGEGYCVICMDMIKVGSDMAAARMPCSHVFHRTCGEKWLNTSAICPVCRTVFPSSP